MKPIRTWIFLTSVFALLILLMAGWEKSGLNGKGGLVFPTLSEYFVPDTAVNRVVQQIIRDTVLMQEPDTSHLARMRDSLRKEQLRLHFAPGNEDALYGFFQSLEKAGNGGQQVRIMHYGDSQIEGDRITGPVRNELQNRFGAAGPGLVPFVPVAPKLFMYLNYVGQWQRYPGFGIVDTNVTHKRYGALVSFSRFAPVKRDSLKPDTALYRASVFLKPSNSSYRGTRKFSKLEIFWGNTREPVTVEVIADGQALPSVVLWPGVRYAREQFDIVENAKEIEIRFTGKDSPDLYAFSLTSPGGVVVDNIPFRGGSGTEISKVAREHLAAMLADLSPKLFILEFGGNVLPYIESKEEAVSYGKWFEAQIRRLKSMAPGSAVIVIGPADMSVKDKTRFVTVPFIEDVRDALKNAAFNTNSGFWDMYGAMGGRNSMPSWVEADPPLAASDYIHFTPKGSTYISKMFIDALMSEYDKWQKKEEKEIEGI